MNTHTNNINNNYRHDCNNLLYIDNVSIDNCIEIFSTTVFGTIYLNEWSLWCDLPVFHSTDVAVVVIHQSRDQNR